MVWERIGLTDRQTVFSSVAFNATDSGRAQTTDFFVPFLIAGVLLTLVCWCIWYFRDRLGLWRQYIALRASEALLKANRKTGGAESMV
jgi:hypothetical protein